MSTRGAIEMVWGIPQWDYADFVVIPKAFLRNYARVGLTDGEAMLVIQLATFKFAIPDSENSEQIKPWKPVTTCGTQRFLWVCPGCDRLAPTLDNSLERAVRIHCFSAQAQVVSNYVIAQQETKKVTNLSKIFLLF